MIEEVEIVILCSNGDRATAPDEGGAISAARQMERDHFDACPVQGRGRDLTFSFEVEGKHVRTVGVKELHR